MIKAPTKLTRKALEYQDTKSDEAFAYILRRLKPWITRSTDRIEYVLRPSEGYQISREDCEQELLTYLIRAINSYDPSKGKGMQFLGHLLSHHATYGVIQRTCNFHQFCVPRKVIEEGVSLSVSKPLTQVSEKNRGVFSSIHERVAEDKDTYKQAVTAMGEVLNSREIVFLTLRCEGCTLKEVGDSFGISRERVRQVESNAYRKLREHLGVDVPVPKIDDIQVCDLKQGEVSCVPKTTSVS